MSDQGYEDRVTMVFEAVRDAGTDGITAAAVGELMPDKATGHEMRAKLMELRRRDRVFYDDCSKRWYAWIAL